MAEKRKTLGIGVIGCGLMGDIHASCYAADPGYRLIGCTSRSRASAEKVAAAHGGAVFDDLAGLLAAPGLEAIAIASPQAVHCEQILAAAAAGKHVFCEKPVALTRDELDAVEAAVRRHGITFMTGHQMRWHPVILAVQKNLRRLGRCYHLQLEWSLRISGHTGRCWETYRLGGFFMELGCHVNDLARFLFGPIVHLNACTLRLDPKRVTEDCTQALVQFESGAIGSLLVSANHRTTRQGLLQGRVLGERGRIDFTVYPYSRAHNRATLVIDHGKSVFVPDLDKQELELPELPSPHRIYAGFFDVYEQQAAAFRKAVLQGKPVPCTLADGRSAVEMVLAAYDRQGAASEQPNFTRPPETYRSGPTCHPLLGKR